MSPISMETFTYKSGEVQYEPNENCLGCCAGQGNSVNCTSDGLARCADGTPLSEDCRNRGCDCEAVDTGDDQPGRVSTVLRSGLKPGPVSIKATYPHDTSVTTTSGQIAIEAGPPVGEEFGISAQYVNLSGLKYAGLEDTITVTASDFWGNAIPNNTAISFKTYNSGGFFSPGSSVTAGGFARTSFFSAYDPAPMQGFASITAEAVNGGRTTHVTCLSAVPKTGHHQILYAGTDGGGVYKSRDSGTTWENISRSSTIQGQNWLDPYVNDVAADMDNPNIVYAATGYGGAGRIYRSLDGGLNWNSNSPEEWLGVFSTDAAVLSVLCDDDGRDTNPDDDRYVWIGTEGYGTYFSTDGKHFQWGDVVRPDAPTEENFDGTYANPDNKGGGYMTLPTLSPSSVSEAWTVTRRATGWEVSGEPGKSGIQTLVAYTGSPYSSDNNEVTFTIVGEAFEPGDYFKFTITESGLGYGRTVKDIVKVGQTHKDSAVLYAATSTGLFRSRDGGRSWSRRTRFTGDSINVLALHPKSSGLGNDVIYAGTEEAGVWVSTDSGASWTSHNSGLSKGLSASTPVAGRDNKGMGVISRVTVHSACLSENWTVTCTEARPNAGIFSVRGTVSGKQADYDISAGEHVIPNVLSFTIIDGTRNDGTGGFEKGDVYTFQTARAPGEKIKDILVDQGNNLLYVVTYFWGPLEPHPVGNLHVHDLNSDGSLVPGDWREASTGLPEFDPPDDTTIFAQHVMAPDVAGNPSALYVGGEGISFSKATEGLDVGNPIWQESKSGFTNLIMARMPILFSGECTMTVTPDIPKGESQFGDTVTFTVYIEDENGNPPVKGSVFDVKRKSLDTGREEQVFRWTYQDSYTSPGTWRDRGDPATNNPLVFSTKIEFLRVSFTFSPKCGTSAPGCSGSEQGYSYP